MGLVKGVSHLLILAEVLHGCSSVIFLSLRCLLRCNRAKKKNQFCSITPCLNVSVLGGWVTLHLAYGFALLVCLLCALQLSSSGISPDLSNCQTVESHNDSHSKFRAVRYVQVWSSGSQGALGDTWVDSVLAYAREINWLLANCCI